MSWSDFNRCMNPCHKGACGKDCNPDSPDIKVFETEAEWFMHKAHTLGVSSELRQNLLRDALSLRSRHGKVAVRG